MHRTWNTASRCSSRVSLTANGRIGRLSEVSNMPNLFNKLPRELLLMRSAAIQPLERSFIRFASTDSKNDEPTPKSPSANFTPHDRSKTGTDRTIYKDQDDTFVDRRFPNWAKPYAKLARVDRPIGSYLLAVPGMWSIALAADVNTLPRADLLILFGVGAFVMRSAGCTINDMWDRDVDSKVERTKNRPLASGQISMDNAQNFLIAQLTVGLGILTQLNEFSILLGASSLGLVALYPLAKRVMSMPQIVLGLTFNWGALLGWAAVHGDVDYGVVLPLYAGAVSWTLFYDTIYAHQDKEDDAKLGLRSSALTIGDERTPAALALFAGGAIAGITSAGYMNGLSLPFYVGMGAAAVHLGWQLSTLKLDDRVNLTERFVSNQWFGSIVLGSIVAGKVLL